MKVFRVFAFCVLLVVLFVIGVLARDQFCEWQLQKNLPYLSPGMTEEEVISRIGKPTTTHIGDIGPGLYWCYGWRSFDDNPDYCGVAIELSGPPRKLVRVLK